MQWPPFPVADDGSACVAGRDRGRAAYRTVQCMACMGRGQWSSLEHRRQALAGVDRLDGATLAYHRCTWRHPTALHRSAGHGMDTDMDVSCRSVSCPLPAFSAARMRGPYEVLYCRPKSLNRQPSPQSLAPWRPGMSHVPIIRPDDPGDRLLLDRGAQSRGW